MAKKYLRITISCGFFHYLKKNKKSPSCKNSPQKEKTRMKNIMMMMIKVSIHHID